MKKAFLNWSSGKDSAFALYQIRKKDEFKIERLVTTVNAEVDRVSMHGIRRELLERQALSLQLPLTLISLPGNVSMSVYSDLMKKETAVLIREGFTHSVFGDIFLQDLKEYRETQLEEAGLKGIFPLWKMNTAQMIRDFIDAGFKAIVVCVNARLLDKSFCGRELDENFIADLPAGIDPCGENGEFHTFVYDGPGFEFPVEFSKGEIVERGYRPSEKEEDNCFNDKKENWDTQFYYCDLLS